MKRGTDRKLFITGCCGFHTTSTNKPGTMVAYACNPGYAGGIGRRTAI
jgi:hypothetical protein